MSNVIRSEPGDPETIAAELTAARASLARYYQRHLEMPDSMAWLKAGEPSGELLERLADQPPEQLAWLDIERAEDVDAGTAIDVWERTKSLARMEFANGHQAAKVLEPVSNPWDRAQFLAVRAGFRDEWQPQGAIEDSLLDVLTQAFTMYQTWLKVLVSRSAAVAVTERKQLEVYGQWRTPTQEDADAIEQAGAMVERFHRLYLRTERALREHRRHAGPVLVQNAGQVNVGGQQVNVVAGSEAT